MSSTTVTATRCWEYRAVYLDRLGGVEADLDQLGDEEWELVSVAADYAYFKRVYRCSTAPAWHPRSSRVMRLRHHLGNRIPYLGNGHI